MKEDKTLEVLLPDQAVTLAGESITVRELRFGEEIQHHTALTKLAEAFFELSTGDDLDSDEGVLKVLDFLYTHWEEVIPVLSTSCGKDPVWIEALSSKEGGLLLMTWWTVNQNFFMRRLFLPLVVKQARLRGEKSSPLS